MIAYFCEAGSYEEIRFHPGALPGRNPHRKHTTKPTGRAAESHPLLSAAGPMKLFAEYGW